MNFNQKSFYQTNKINNKLFDRQFNHQNITQDVSNKNQYNKAMYASTMQPSQSSKYVGKLETMGRFVQSSNETPQIQLPRYEKNNMFSSSIFTQSNYQEMNRFPAFNLHPMNKNNNSNANMENNDIKNNNFYGQSNKDIHENSRKSENGNTFSNTKYVNGVNANNVSVNNANNVNVSVNNTNQLNFNHPNNLSFNTINNVNNLNANVNSYNVHNMNVNNQLSHTTYTTRDNSNYNTTNNTIKESIEQKRRKEIEDIKKQLEQVSKKLESNKKKSQPTFEFGRKSGKLQKEVNNPTFKEKEHFHDGNSNQQKTTSSNYFDNYAVSTQEIQINQPSTINYDVLAKQPKLNDLVNENEFKETKETTMNNKNVNQKIFLKKKNPYIQTHLYNKIENSSQNQMENQQSNKKVGQNQNKKEKRFTKNDFEIGKKMGKGQFGEVMLVRHKGTGFMCGMKIMSKKQIKDQKYQSQIARELSIQFYLAHRNIAPLYGYFTDEENVYLLLEFCVGGQLLEKLRKDRRMTQEDTSPIIRQICEGVDYIHRQLIIHRDIKPQNILFSFGVVKICDFGWAVYRGHGLRKTASGSPLYYSPEIVLGNEYDQKIDIWDIGMMVYECLFGKVPFKVYTEMDLKRIVTDEVVFPEYVDVSEDAKDFILNTLKKVPNQRMEIKQMLRHPFITKHKDKRIPQIEEEIYRVIK